MKKSLLRMSEEIISEVKQGFALSMTSADMSARIDDYIQRNMYTASGNKRYPNYYSESLRCTAMATKTKFQDDFTTFGYWYNNEFYATSVNAKKFGLNSTNELHALNLTQQQWDAMERGTYYHNLKPYFTMTS